MTIEQFAVLQKLNTYLEEQKEDGIQAFKKLSVPMRNEQFDLVGLSFTYENIEVIARKKGKDKYLSFFEGVLSQAKIDELTHLDFDEENVFDDYNYYIILLSLKEKMIEQWIADCFHQSKILSKIDTPIYFKSSFDGMEILDLSNLKTLYEKSEFEVFSTLNKGKNIIELFPV